MMSGASQGRRYVRVVYAACITSVFLMACSETEPVAPISESTAADGRSAAVSVPGERATQKARPSILVIVVDTLRRDHLGAYGYGRATSPNIDALTSVGTRYDAAISQAPWTAPSIAALVTSRYPSTLGVSEITSVIPGDAVLISEALGPAGYATGAVVSHRFCSARWGFAQGYDSFDESNVLDHAATTSPGVTDAALKFINANADGPFFLLLHYFDPHFAYLEHEGFTFASEAPYSGPIGSGLSFRDLLKMRAELTRADLDELERFYDSEIAFTDHHIGRVFHRLRELGIFDEMLIVLTADHGEEFKDHGRIGHTKTLYDELIRVPLILKYPRGKAAVETETVGVIDVYPTILDVAGVSVSHAIDGRSLVANHQLQPRTLFSETDRPKPRRAAIQGGFKLIEFENGRHWLYDTGGDTAERTDLSAQRPDQVEALRRELADHRARSQTTDATAPRVGLSPEDLEALRGLGYIEPDE